MRSSGSPDDCRKSPILPSVEGSIAATTALTAFSMSA